MGRISKQIYESYISRNQNYNAHMDNSQYNRKHDINVHLDSTLPEKQNYFERFVAISYPFKPIAKKLQKRRVIFCICLFALLVCFAVGSVQLYYYTYYDSIRSCGIRSDSLKEGSMSFYFIWTHTIEGIFFLLLPCINGFNNMCLIYKLKNQFTKLPQEQRQWNAIGSIPIQMTVTHLIISFFYITTNLTSSIVYVILLYYPSDWPFVNLDYDTNEQWISYIRVVKINVIVRQVCFLRYVANFLLFLICSKNFRSLVFLKFCFNDFDKPPKNNLIS
ncbi:hypothetical protein A3Q56_07715 [Intoshia linei]|uniref:Uncharacterized protein n=1 Tax=Intoshia linei TaxID=1819745 RepID=A0A177AT76_9BILA|nr:hypothetical protein A3Q56_07715 [Intoshia linei]